MVGYGGKVSHLHELLLFSCPKTSSTHYSVYIFAVLQICKLQFIANIFNVFADICNPLLRMSPYICKYFTEFTNFRCKWLWILCK